MSTTTLLDERSEAKTTAAAAPARKCVECDERAVPSGDPTPRCMYHTFADEARWNLERLIAKGDGRALDEMASELYRAANATPTNKQARTRPAPAPAPGDSIDFDF